MDDLLDLSWSEPPRSSSSSTFTAQKSSQTKPEKPKDAFADLLATTPKPVDISKLSLIERQKLQQQQQQPSNTSSPWLTPIQATTPISPPNNTSRLTPPPALTSPAINKAPISNTNSSSFENLLSSFGSNNRNQDAGKSTPLNQLRTPTSTAISSGEWDLDFLDTKLNTNTSNETSAIDPFDMNSLTQHTGPPHTSNLGVQEHEEDDNPLGILAGPAIKLPQPEETLEPEISLPESPLQHNRSFANRPGLMLDEDEEDAMLAQLIEMGFSLRESKFAIEATAGQDLQSAVDLLVQNARSAQSKPPLPTATARSSKAISQNERARNSLFADENEDSSSTMQPRTRPRHQGDAKETHDHSLQETTDKIVSQAQELGGFLYKNATSYFKAGREKVSKAVGDWQEQQRAQRLQQMQEAQNGTVRPKWMQGNGDETLDMSSKPVEQFADDEDSGDEGRDLKAERRRVQEMRKQQELKHHREQAAAAHKQRQQQKLRKDALSDDEQETYASPSRRRGGSGRSTSRSNASPLLEKQQPVPTAPPADPKNTRSRTRVNASPDVMARAHKARLEGNEKFKLGQFGESEEAYTCAIDILPAEHGHQVLLYNNRAMARLKIGQYKKCIEDCDVALVLAKQSSEESSTCEGVVIQWREQIVKSLSRKAEALENIERYKDALAAYDELIKYEGGNNPKTKQAMSRCRQALNPSKKRAPSTPRKSEPAEPTDTTQDFMSMLDLNAPSAASKPTVSDAELSKSKAVAAMRAKAAEQEAEDAERLEKTDHVNARLIAWKAGKEQNLRALLATLDTLLWPGAQWKGAQMSELINPKKCKIIYMKAIGKVHPDKLPSDVTVEQRMLASGIFASLNEAWDSFKAQNQL
ncbi:hypothetical protein [Parasitella parasitica]|uniref:UBA domain-containing protein n=1 Tax=Parasitella parasitica TaxID=35722 RepID=A0A0B7NNK8_9FUNG|nr:hypothetical protein [Parasitella parasitica]